MTHEGAPTLWTRVEDALAQPVDSAKKNDVKKVEKESTRTIKVHWKLLNSFGSILWILIFIKLFVGDVERWLIASVSPTFLWILDFRFIGSLALVSIILIATRRKKWWVAVYLLLFPLIVTLWKIPRFIYQRRSWSLAIGVIHVVVGTFKKLAKFFVMLTILVLATTVIILQAGQPFVAASMALLGALWIVNLGGAALGAFRLDGFVTTQNKVVTTILRSKAFWNMIKVEDTLRGDEVTEYTRDQATQLVTKASMGIVASRATQVWAEKLDAYRRSPAFVIFGSLTVIGLFIQVVYTSALVNYGLHQLAPNQFAADFNPTIATFFYYAFSSALGSEISGFVPRDGWAVAIHMGTGFSTVVVLLVLVVSLIFGIKQSRSDATALAAIASLRQVADEFEARVARDYGMEGQGLRSRLIEFEGSFGKLLAYFATQMGHATGGVDSTQPPQRGGFAD